MDNIAIGTIKYAKELGFSDYSRRIWIPCKNCGKLRWASFRNGRSNDYCQPCSQKIGKKHTLKRGVYCAARKLTSICGVCKVEYPATDEFFSRSKQTKTGLCLGRCKRCTHRIAKSRSLSTMKGRLNRRMSHYIRMSLNGKKCFRSWELLVGYTLKDLMQHLEKRFKLGMTWENYGNWHIDHIIPQSAFHYTTPDDIDFKRCWALSNLQPLWGIENILKSNKIQKPFQPSLRIK